MRHSSPAVSIATTLARHQFRAETRINSRQNTVGPRLRRPFFCHCPPPGQTARKQTTDYPSCAGIARKDLTRLEGQIESHFGKASSTFGPPVWMTQLLISERMEAIIARETRSASRPKFSKAPRSALRARAQCGNPSPKCPNPLHSSVSRGRRGARRNDFRPSRSLRSSAPEMTTAAAPSPKQAGTDEVSRPKRSSGLNGKRAKLNRKQQARFFPRIGASHNRPRVAMPAAPATQPKTENRYALHVRALRPILLIRRASIDGLAYACDRYEEERAN